jgi:short-subunit dehydrogenase
MSDKRKPINEQVIVITGASSGIGLATALTAADQGASVVAAARSEQTLQELAEHINQHNGKAIAVPTDVSIRGDVERLASDAIASFGRIDTWVNNAAIGSFGRLEDMLEEDSRRIFDVNFWGLVYGSLVALPYLKESHGTLVNVGSEVSEDVLPLQGMYSATKHAVMGFSDALRLELESDGSPVRIALIQPTAVDTPFPENAANYLDAEPKLPTPMIDPADVAEAILNAAVKPRNHIKVGAVATLNTAMAKVFPALFEEVAKMQMGRQQRDEPGHKREGTLYEPGEQGRVYGRGNENAADRKEAAKSNRKSA